MAKFHVNDSNEVGSCSAEIKCRFGGESGMENHFSSREEAERFAEKRLEEKFNPMKSSRGSTSSLDVLKSRGVQIETVKNLESHSFDVGEELQDSSTIDLIEEKADLDLLNRIKSGELSYSSL